MNDIESRNNERRARLEESIAWSIEHGRPLDTMREDIRLRSLAIELGYTIVYGVSPGDSLIFKKGNRTIYNIAWQMWICTTLTNEMHSDARKYTSLEEGGVEMKGHIYMGLGLEL